MGWQTIRQPNGNLAVWSTIVDSFIAENLSVEDVLGLYQLENEKIADMNCEFAWSKYSPEKRVKARHKFIEEANKGLREMVEAVAAGVPRSGNWTWEEAVYVQNRVHGRRR